MRKSVFSAELSMEKKGFIEPKIIRNLEYPEHGSTKIPKYFFEIDLTPIIPRAGASRIPVYWRPNPSPHPMLKEIYSAEIAGITIEKGNLFSLKDSIPDVIQSIIDFGTLPYYYLIFPGGRIPVYHCDDNKFHIKMRGGPEFSGENVSVISKKFSDYLIDTHLIRRMSEVDIALLYWKEMRLYPSAFILTYGENVWVPIFYREDGDIKLNYDVVGTPSKIYPLTDAFKLRREIGEELSKLRIIPTPYDLRMENVSVWKNIEKFASKTGFVMVLHHENERKEIPIYHGGGEFFVPLEGKYGLSIDLSQSIEELERKFSRMPGYEITIKREVTKYGL